MGGIMHHKATWFVLGAVAMYFAFPYVAAMVPKRQGS